MGIGNTIFRLRTAKNLSQGDLAELLDVSRQSVSKWETDTAVPDLDKLIKLCDVFGVTLDELTGREKIKPNPTAKPEGKNISTVQKTIGYILFATSLLFVLLILLFGSNGEETLVLLPFAMSLLACGLLCLFAGKRAYYWCIWTALSPMTIFTPRLVGLPFLSSLSLFLILLLIIMIFVARRAFHDVVIKKEKKKSLLLALAWILTASLYTLRTFLPAIHAHSSGAVAVHEGFSILTSLLCYVLFACLETYTVCYLGKKSHKQNCEKKIDKRP